MLVEAIGCDVPENVPPSATTATVNTKTATTLNTETATKATPQKVATTTSQSAIAIVEEKGAKAPDSISSIKQAKLTNTPGITKCFMPKVQRERFAANQYVGEAVSFEEMQEQVALEVSLLPTERNLPVRPSQKPFYLCSAGCRPLRYFIAPL